MKKILIPVAGLLLLAGCSQSPKEETATGTTNAVEIQQQEPAGEPSPVAEKEQPARSARAEEKGEKATVDFLTACDALEVWQGAIQGVPAAETGGIYVMAQCFTNKDFDLIVFSNKKLGLGEAADDKRGTIKAGIPGAEYYAFEIPKKEAEESEEETEAFSYVFPSQVKVYKRFEDGWYLIRQERVSSFEELGQLKYSTVHKRTRS